MNPTSKGFSPTTEGPPAEVNCHSSQNVGGSFRKVHYGHPSFRTKLWTLLPFKWAVKVSLKFFFFSFWFSDCATSVGRCIFACFCSLHGSLSRGSLRHRRPGPSAYLVSTGWHRPWNHSSSLIRWSFQHPRELEFGKLRWKREMVAVCKMLEAKSSAVLHVSDLKVYRS